MSFSSIFGSLLSGAASLSASKAQIAQQNQNVRDQILAQTSENQKNREYNLMLARLQNRYSVEQWQRENDYNSPSAMMQRLREAGLNPNLALSGGVMSGLRAASSPEMTSGAASTPNDMSAILSRRTAGESLMYGINSALEASQAASNFASARKQNQEAKTEAYGTDVMRSKAKFADALYSGAVRLQNANIVLTGDKSKLTRQQEEVAYYEAQYYSQKIDESKVVIERDLAAIRQADEKIQIEAFRAAMQSKEIEARVKNLAAQTRMTEQEIYAKALMIPLQVTNLQRENLLLGWKGVSERELARGYAAHSDQLELDFNVNESMAEWRKATEIATDVVDIGTSISREVREWYGTYTGAQPLITTESEYNSKGKGFTEKQRKRVRSRLKH